MWIASKPLNNPKNTSIIMEFKINWDHRRVKHALERMWLRGISVKDIGTAIKRGKKVKQRKSGLYESFFSFYSVVYDERFFDRNKIRKIYPVTVKIW